MTTGLAILGSRVRSGWRCPGRADDLPGQRLVGSPGGSAVVSVQKKVRLGWLRLGRVGQ